MFVIEILECSTYQTSAHTLKTFILHLKDIYLLTNINIKLIFKKVFIK